MNEFESYSESWPAWVTYSEAVRELAYHGVTMDLFTRDHGVRSRYRSQTVLGWLGY